MIPHNQEFTFLIMKHLMWMECIVNSTNKLHSFADQGDIESIFQESENRERLISIANHSLKQIEETSFKVKHQPNSTYAILWKEDTQKLLDQIDQRDLSLLEKLNHLRIKTLENLAITHQNKNMLRGYDLNNLKR